MLARRTLTQWCSVRAANATRDVSGKNILSRDILYIFKIYYILIYRHRDGTGRCRDYTKVVEHCTSHRTPTGSSRPDSFQLKLDAVSDDSIGWIDRENEIQPARCDDNKKYHGKYQWITRLHAEYRSFDKPNIATPSPSSVWSNGPVVDRSIDGPYYTR